MTAEDEVFVGDPLEPKAGTFDAAAMGAGGPGLARRFLWRGEAVEVAAVLRTWKETGPMKGARSGGEQYVRKHWFEVRTTGGEVLTLYVERQARTARETRRRWWLFSRRPAGPAGNDETRDPKGPPKR